jgi:uncharacterized protein
MSLYATTVPQLRKMLTNLDGWFEKAIAQAQNKKYDAAILLQQRLAPDQYPLIRQVQAACDAAKFLAARLAAKDPPKHPDTEQTMDEIRQRIRTVVSYLDTIKESDYAGAETRAVELSYLPAGKVVGGLDYANELALPNFYFHVTTAYAILRHNGVDLGKMDYIGSINLKDKT